MTQKDWILKYIIAHGSVVPARMGGVVWEGKIWPACGMRRCQEMEASGELKSDMDGRFKRFSLKKEIPEGCILVRGEIMRVA